ncbi:hypothetical protein DFH09DRAFT_1088891 [Mycena vulgaris]|nr:hypothetical protein DFH09DRAFT_1088891 [Mycena vulgaris]
MCYDKSEGAEPSRIVAWRSLSSFQMPRVRAEPAADDLLKTIKNISKEQFLGRALSSASSCNEGINRTIAQLHSSDREQTSWHYAARQLQNCSITQLQNCSITQVKSKELQNRSTTHMKFTTAYLPFVIAWGINSTTAQLYSGRRQHTSGNCAVAHLQNCSMAQVKVIQPRTG